MLSALTVPCAGCRIVQQKSVEEETEWSSGLRKAQVGEFEQEAVDSQSIQLKAVPKAEEPEPELVERHAYEMVRLHSPAMLICLVLHRRITHVGKFLFENKIRKI